ncbi:MAG: tetratricopeptide repeat protein [Thermoguttaceae bacterium]|nr:tetratricopeptide repeat protein [Thermoguttaceae bacterium]
MTSENWFLAVAVVLLTAAFGYFYGAGFFWRRLAAVATKDERFEEAERAYRRALAISPRDARLWFWLGLTERRLGRGDAALESLRRAGELDPNAEEVFAERADLLHERGELGEALRELTWIVESQPTPFSARLTRSSILIEKGRFEEAIADCDWLIENGDEAACAGAFNNRGVAKLALGRDETAAVDFETAYLIDPECPISQAHCAGTWLRRGAPEKTLRLCNAILRVDETNGVAFHWRGLAKRALGDETGAVEDLRRAEELGA